MIVFTPELIIKRRLIKKISYRSLAKTTAEIDPEGEGVSAMTCMRIETERGDPKVSSVILICAALGISPKSTYINKET